MMAWTGSQLEMTWYTNGTCHFIIETNSFIDCCWNMARLEDYVASMRLPLSLSIFPFRCFGVFFFPVQRDVGQMATSYQWLCHLVSEAIMKQCQPVIPSLHETNMAATISLKFTELVSHLSFISSSCLIHMLLYNFLLSEVDTLSEYLSGNFDHAIICFAHWCLSLLSPSPFLTNPVHPPWC